MNINIAHINIHQKSAIFTFATLLLVTGIVSLFGYEIKLIFRFPLIIFGGAAMYLIYKYFFTRRALHSSKAK